ncbi:serine--pyruvate aminotransferase, mitochondrial-like [Agrilus planipennis]|uniref:Alanine--glyoxylate aminotransferase n=1 Tax=Agrilus planipennis TaxID=224129 RepID=A0A7F5RB54_AGRPL|nr:serine--pyruvate aminotransferase, mitochondrial-like [Agrilus planipennis]
MEITPPPCLNKPLKFPNKLLMGPGPSNCSPRVLHALSLPILGHMHTETFQIMDEIKEGIKYIFQTKNELTLAISAAGHGGMEAVLCNLVEPGDKVLVAVNGLWGMRAIRMAENYGAVVSQIATSLGNNYSLGQLETAILSEKPDLLFVVQGESSTGVYQPLESLGKICHKYNCLLAVDTVASLGAVPFFMDKWEVDAVYTGSQKVLSAPPGITPISFSKRAQTKIFQRKSRPSVYYFDMNVVGEQWGCVGTVRTYHHTVSSSLLCGLREALAIICEEGIENSMKRHKECTMRLHDGLKRLGLEFFVGDPEARLPTVTSIKIPEGVDWKKITTTAMNTYNLEIGGGLGPTAGLIGRVGIMGYNAQPENIDFLLSVLQKLLKDKCKL